METAGVEDSGAGEAIINAETVGEASTAPATEPQPLADETAVTTAESRADLETPANGGGPILTSGSVESLKEDTALAPTSLDQPQISPGEKKIDDATENLVQPLSSNDDILLNFGVSDGGVAKESLPLSSGEIKQETTASNDFDLLGFTQPETANTPPADDAAAMGDAMLLGNEATDKSTETNNDASPEPVSDLLGDATLSGNNDQVTDKDSGTNYGAPEPVSDLLGLSSEDNVSYNEQQQSSESSDAQNMPEDKKAETQVEASDPPTDSPNGISPINEDSTVEQLPVQGEMETHIEDSTATSIADGNTATKDAVTEATNVTDATVDQLPTEEEAEKNAKDSNPTDFHDENAPSNEDSTLDSENENASAPNQSSSLGEKDENVDASETLEVDPSMVESGHETQELTAESNANEEEVTDNAGHEVPDNAANAGSDNTAKEEPPPAGDQVNELGKDNIVETSAEAVTSEYGTIVEIPQEQKTVAQEETEVTAGIDTLAVSPSVSPDGEQPTIESDNNASTGPVNEDVEERTEEEEEWLNMGLGLGDALRQIVALTEERDSALTICQEKEDGKVQAEALLVEVQTRLGAEMTGRAEYESEVRGLRETLKSYEERLKTYEGMEDDLEKAQASLVQVVSEKSKIELEVQKLREIRDESEQKEVVLSNRLNEAKKKEANRSTAAGRLEVDNEKLREDLQQTKDELENTKKAKTKLESNMEKLKAKAVERVKQAETALAEERELNEERKKKMKVFVETKAEELREAKESANDLQKELEETRASLRSSRDREESFQKELDAARLKYRELQRDMERMKRNSEEMHKMGHSLEQELEKSASETEEHKKKRMSAKHEIMQMVRTLEVERAVSSKLKESVKFSFTPKALSQQELLTECLRDFELELEKLAAKMGKTLEHSPELSKQAPGAPADGPGTPEINGASRKSKKTRGSKADVDTDRLISNLEQETQNVSKGIMALTGSIERMRLLLNDDNMFGCMTYFSNILAGTGEARHQRLESDAHEENHTDQFV